MVNKILKIGNQIVSVGGEIVNTPNPELEVVQMPYSNDVSGYLDRNVEKGEIVYKFRDAFEDVSGGLQNIGQEYLPIFYEKDGVLHCWVYSSGGWVLYWYKDEVWTLKSGLSGKGRGLTNGQTGPRTSVWTYPHEVDGKLAFCNAMHLRDHGRYKGFEWAIQTDDDYWDHKDPIFSTSGLDDYADPEMYNINNDIEQRRQCEAASIFQDSSGTVHGAVGWYANTNNEASAYATEFSGRKNFKTYQVNTETNVWTQTTHDNATVQRFVYAIDFIEVSGSVYMMTASEEIYLLTSNNNYHDAGVSSFALYPDDIGDGWPSENRIAYTIYKWNAITSNWDFHQFNRYNRQAQTIYNAWSDHLDASTHIFHIRGSGSNFGCIPLRYEASSGYFKEWGVLDASARMIGGMYTNRVFKEGDDYYILAGGASDMRYVLEGSGIYSSPTSETQPNLHRLYNSSENLQWEEAKYSLLRLYKYNPSTEIWDRQHHDELSFTNRRISPGQNATSRQYCRGVNVYKFNGETHMVVCADSYGGDSLKFFKFDGATNTIINNTPPRYTSTTRMRSADYGLDDITQSGTIYRVNSSAEYPYIHISTYDISGEASGSWQIERYMPDVISSYTYMPSWYEASTGELFVFVAANRSQERLVCYKWNKDLRQLEKVASTNIADNITISNSYNYYGLSKIFTLGGKEYLFMSSSANKDQRYLYEINLDSSGLPILSDTSTTLYTAQGGYTDAYGSEDLQIIDGKLWFCRAAYQTPYHGLEVFTWDGTASSFSSVPVTSRRWTTATGSGLDPIRETNYMNRSRGGCKFFEINGELWAHNLSENWPPHKFHKYIPEENKFVEWEYGGYAYRVTTQYNVSWRTVVKDNVAYWLQSHYGGAGGFMDQLMTFDGSSMKNYPISFRTSTANHSQEFRGNLYINHDNEIEYYGSYNSSYNQIDRIFRLNPNYLTYDGYWTNQDGNNNMSQSVEIGVALESGNKGDIIQIRRLSRS